MNQDWRSITEQVVDAVRVAGAFIRQELGKVTADNVEIKAKNSLVSYVDQNAEKMLVEALSEIIPGSGFITEEDTLDDSTKQAVWIIDPLDGTTNFLHGIPHFSTSVALQYEGELMVGVVYNIMADEMYHAWSGGGAYRNKESISASKQTDFSQCILATGFPYATDYDKQPYFQMMDVIMREARGMRRFGSAALDMAYVADGRFDAFYETSLNPWDVAGGIVICKEAGAEISDYFGTGHEESGSSIITANKEILQKIRSYTSVFFAEQEIAKI